MIIKKAKMDSIEYLMTKIRDLYHDFDGASIYSDLPPNYIKLKNIIADFLYNRGEFTKATWNDNTGGGGAISFAPIIRAGNKKRSQVNLAEPSEIGTFGFSSDEAPKRKKASKKVSPKETIDQADPADIYANVSIRANNRIQGEVYGPSGTGRDGDFSKFDDPQAAKDYFMKNFSGQAADHLHFAKFLRAFKHRERNMQESFMKSLTRYNESRWTL